MLHADVGLGGLLASERHLEVHGGSCFCTDGAADLKKAREHVGGQDFPDDPLPGIGQLGPAQLQALLHHIAAELLLGQLWVVALQLLHDPPGCIPLRQVQHILDNVVSKGVLQGKEESKVTFNVTHSAKPLSYIHDPACRRHSGCWFLIMCSFMKGTYCSSQLTADSHTT